MCCLMIHSLYWDEIFFGALLFLSASFIKVVFCKIHLEFRPVDLLFGICWLLKDYFVKKQKSLQKWVHPILTQHGVENLKRQHQFPCALRHKRSFYYKWFGPDDWRNNKPPTDFQLKKQWNENKKKTILALFILPLRRYSSSIPLINFSNLDTQILVLECILCCFIFDKRW